MILIFLSTESRQGSLLEVRRKIRELRRENSMKLVITVLSIIRIVSVLIINYWNFKRVKDDEITENTYVLWTILSVLLLKF